MDIRARLVRLLFNYDEIRIKSYNADRKEFEVKLLCELDPEDQAHWVQTFVERWIEFDWDGPYLEPESKQEMLVPEPPFTHFVEE